MMISTFARFGDQVRTSFEHPDSGPPAWIGEGDLVASTARLAAARAAARQVVFPELGDARPPVNFDTDDDRNVFNDLDRIEQWQLRRVMAGRQGGARHGSSVGKRDKDLWQLLPDLGTIRRAGWSQSEAVWPQPLPGPRTDKANDPRGVLAAWEMPWLCVEHSRWAALLGGEEVEELACQRPPTP